MSTNAKDILFEEDARNKLKDGIDQLANVVSIALGPRGRNVGLQAAWGSPQITSDGNSIAKDIELKDPFANMGVSLAKEVAAKIKERAGDGTTTGIVLFRALVQAGLKNIAAGASPILLKRGMEKALERVMKELDRMSIPIQTGKEICNIATVSASGYQEIGEAIAECFEKVGKSGVIAIEEGKSTETCIEIVDGMQFNQGYASAYFCTNTEKLNCTLNDVRILVTDKKISSIQDLLPLLQNTAAAGQELLILADDIEGDALSTLVINKMRGTLKVAAVKAPGFGDRKKALMQDIAILTGATLVTEETGLLLKQAGPEVLGKADQIIISKDKTIIVGGKGKGKEIKARVLQIDAELKKATSSYDVDHLEERKAKLSGGVAVIKVGAPTESEMKKKKQMFEDSLNATRAALEEGIVVGGGIALLRGGRICEELNLSPEERLGAQILMKATEAPFRQIVANAGFDSSVLQGEILRSKEGYGFNAITEKVEDLLKAGVIDPLKVVKSSLSHAVSMAGVVLLSEALIANS
jgi:chaperonin GroEL